MAQFIDEEEFDKKLKEVGDLYEAGKDALYQMYSPTNKYEWDKVFESLRSLRDIAATNLKAIHEIKID